MHDTPLCTICAVLRDDTSRLIIARGKHVTALRKPRQSKSVNFLVVSNEHIENLKKFDRAKHQDMLSEMVEMVNALSRGGTTGDWSMRIHNGSNSDQTIFHLHAHISANDSQSSWFSRL